MEFVYFSRDMRTKVAHAHYWKKAYDSHECMKFYGMPDVACNKLFKNVIMWAQPQSRFE